MVTKVRIVPNVKLIKNISKLSAEGHQDMLDDGIIEKRNHKKFGDVITCYKIVNADGYDDESPLTEFDAWLRATEKSAQYDSAKPHQTYTDNYRH